MYPENKQDNYDKIFHNRTKNTMIINKKIDTFLNYPNQIIEEPFTETVLGTLGPTLEQKSKVVSMHALNYDRIMIRI